MFPCPAPRWRKNTSAIFPDENTIWSYGSGYGGNALLGKKCLACGSVPPSPGVRAGWRTHDILRLYNPEGRQYHITRLPISLRQKPISHDTTDISSWKAECIGDDIAWMKIAPDGRLRAINAEAGFSAWRRALL